MENITRTIDGVLEKGQDFQNQYQGIKERTSATVRAASEKGNQVWDDTVEFVRKNPAQAVGISLAAGAALGVLAYALISRGSSPSSRFQKITDASHDGWDNVKEALDKGLGGLKQALHNVQSSLK